jgi:hypothetical protein
VTASRFNEAIKRNADRFPEDFRFQLSREEFVQLAPDGRSLHPDLW